MNTLTIQGPPKSAVLQDGTEVRLVPLERTGGKPLYISKNAVGYSYIRGSFRRINYVHNLTFSRQEHVKNRRKKYVQFTAFKNILVHHAVLLAWVGPCPDGYQADHINGNAGDNRLENLEWVTPAENMRRAVNLRRLRKMAAKYDNPFILPENIGSERLRKWFHGEFLQLSLQPYLDAPEVNVTIGLLTHQKNK